MFLVSQWFLFRNFLLCCLSQRSARNYVPSQVATHQADSCGLGRRRIRTREDAGFEPGKTPDSNPGRRRIRTREDAGFEPGMTPDSNPGRRQIRSREDAGFEPGVFRSVTVTPRRLFLFYPSVSAEHYFGSPLFRYCY